MDVVSHGMHRALVLAAVVLAVAACKKRSRPAADPPVAAAPIDAASAGPPDLSFVRGDLLLLEERDGLTRPLRLDPATGAWSALATGGDANLFPTGHRVRGGVLCIATWGATEADHVEQLAIVKDGKAEPYGPRALKVRNPAPVRDDQVVIESDAESFSDLYLVAPDGKSTRLTDDQNGNFEPAASADGRTVAFASSRDGNAELYQLDVAQAGAARPAATRLTSTPRDEWGAAWSPDGKTLAFLSDRDGAPRAYLMGSGGAVRLTAESAPGAIEDQLRWSPDGKYLAYLRGDGAALSVVLVEVTTRKPRTVTPPARVDLDFAWSPDGAHLAIIRHPDRDPRSQGTVVIVRAADGTVVATDDTAASAVRWVP